MDIIDVSSRAFFKQAEASWSEHDFFHRPLIDDATPKSALTKKDVNGEELRLVWSDEFEVEGRTFYPGDDPFLEAIETCKCLSSDMKTHASRTTHASRRLRFHIGPGVLCT